MITLSLLHPIKQVPVQVWTFENESVIRIGRSTDNHVVLYSAVVSRHHVELRRTGESWELVSLGTNGTYLNGKRINQGAVADGTVIRLARSGPNIKIRLGAEALNEFSGEGEGDRTVSQQQEYQHVPTEITAYRQDQADMEEFETSGDVSANPGLPQKIHSQTVIPVPPHLKLT